MQTAYDYFVEPKEGPALIVGSRIYDDKPDRRKLYKDVRGVDMLDGPGVDIVHNLEEAPMVIQYAHIECMSVMEHSRRPWLMAANIEKSLMEGGTLFLTVPFVWRFHGYPNDYFRFTAEGVRTLFPNIRWRSLDLVSEDIIVKKPFNAGKTGDGVFLSRTEVFGMGVKK